MKPGATTSPSASISRTASPGLILPMRVITPSLMPTSPLYRGLRAPSTIMPFRMTMS
jgi:hypothetical protein